MEQNILLAFSGYIFMSGIIFSFVFHIDIVFSIYIFILSKNLINFSVTLHELIGTYHDVSQAPSLLVD